MDVGLAMQRREGLSILELIRHIFTYAVVLTLFALEAAYGTVVSSLAARVITSEFVLYVMKLMEHAIVVSSALCITHDMARDVWKRLRRIVK
jgi:hypothetical protein